MFDKHPLLPFLGSFFGLIRIILHKWTRGNHRFLRLRGTVSLLLLSACVLLGGFLVLASTPGDQTIWVTETAYNREDMVSYEMAQSSYMDSLGAALVSNRIKMSADISENRRSQVTEALERQQSQAEREQAFKEEEEQAQIQLLRVQQEKEYIEEARAMAEEAERLALEQKNATRVIPVTQEDYESMLRIVQAEAGGCDAKGKILVADVVINRVRSKQFPDTVTDVIYEPKQFQPVTSGLIKRVEVSADTVACVDRALEGEDYSDGALYFMNRQLSGSQAAWFDGSLTYLFAHDGHEFYK